MRLSVLLLLFLALSPTTEAGLIHHSTFDETAGSSASDTVGGNSGNWVPGIDATPDWKSTGGLFGGAIQLPGNGNHQNYFATSGFPALNGTPAGMSDGLAPLTYVLYEEV